MTDTTVAARTAFDDLPDLLTEVDVHNYTGMSRPTLRRWRSEGSQGPKFIKLGAAVRYPKDSLRAWLDSLEVSA